MSETNHSFLFNKYSRKYYAPSIDRIRSGAYNADMKCRTLLPASLLLPGFVMITATTDLHAFVYKDVDVNVKGAVGETYDDNIAYSNLAREKDFITNLIAGLGVQY